MKKKLLFVISLFFILNVSANKPAFDFDDPDCQVTAITTDLSGNLFIAGCFIDTLSFGAKKVAAQTFFGSIFVAKYDIKGKLKWVSTVNLNQLSGVFSITADNKGNAFITGSFIESITFGKYTLNGLSGAFLVKYGPDGEVVWAKKTSCETKRSITIGMIVATDSKDNIYETGEFSDSVSSKPYMEKYDCNGTFIWQKTGSVKDNNHYDVTAFTVDNEFNIYESGNLWGTVQFGRDTLSPTSVGALFIAKYEQDGNVIWAKKTPANYIKGYGGAKNLLRLDTMGNIYVMQTGKYVLGSDTNSGTILLKYDKNGNRLWLRKSDKEQSVPDVFSNEKAEIYYSVNGLAEYDAIQLKKYNIDGKCLFNKHVKLPGKWGYFPITTTDITGNVYVVGGFIDPKSGEIKDKYSDTYIDKFNADGQILWSKKIHCSHSPN